MAQISEDELYNRIIKRKPELAKFDRSVVLQRVYERKPELRDAVSQPNAMIGEGKAEGIRGRYLSEKIFNPVTEGLAQAGAGLAMARPALGTTLPGRAALLAGSAMAGIVGGGVEGARQITQRIAGEPIAPQTSEEAASRIARQMALSAGSEGLGQTVMGIAGKVFAPKQLTPFQQGLRKSFEDKGIPYTPADILGPSGKGYANLESLAEKTAFGTGVIGKFREGQRVAFKNVVDDLVKKSGGKITNEEAGSIVINAVKEASKIKKAEVDAAYDIAYDAIDKNAPRKSLQSQRMAQKLLTTPKYGRIDEGEVLSAKAKEILNSLAKKETVINPEDVKLGLPPQYEKLRIGDLLADERKLTSYIQEQIIDGQAKGMAFNTTPEGKLLVELKKSVVRDIDDFFKYANPQAKKKLDAAKQIYQEGKTTYGSEAVFDLVKTSPDKVVDKLVKFNNNMALKNIKGLIGEKEFAPIPQRTIQNFSEGVFGDTAEQNTAEMIFRHRAVKNMLADINEETRETLFGKDGVKQLEEIVKISNAMEAAEKLAPATGSSRVNSLFLSIADSLTKPAITAVTLGAPYLYARMITSKTGRDLILDGLKVQPGTKEAAKFATRFATFASLAAAQEKKNK